MKITVGRLKKIIKEANSLKSDLSSQFSPEQHMFYSILHNLAQDQNGLRLTHETFVENIDSIETNGIQMLDHAISCFVGWDDTARWITGPAAIVQFTLPSHYITTQIIVPDDKYSSDPNESFFSFMEEFPDVVGGEIALNLKVVKPEFIDNIVQLA